MIVRKSAKSIVWIVDDNKYFCSQLAELLKESSLIKEVLPYYSCESALESLSASSFKLPDVILLDVYFSKSTMTGLSAIDFFKKKAPKSRIIILTAFEEENNARIAFEMGANGFLTKCESAVKIIKAVELSLLDVSFIESTIASKIFPRSSTYAILTSNHVLTLREKKIINLLFSGFKRPKIANKLSISIATVNTHLRNIHSKLDVNSDIEIITKMKKE